MCILKLEINIHCDLKRKLKIFEKEKNMPLMYKFEIHSDWAQTKIKLKK